MMIEHLFSAQATLEGIPMEDAEIYYLPKLPLTQPAEAIMNHLIDEVPWRAENIVVWGKTIPQPHLIVQLHFRAPPDCNEEDH